MMACRDCNIPDPVQPGDRYPGESVRMERARLRGTSMICAGLVAVIAGVCMRTTHLGIGLMLIGLAVVMGGALLREMNEVRA